MNVRPQFRLISLALLAMLLISSFIAIHPVQANPRVNVEIGVFHDALAPYGNWVNHRTYGQVWYPRNVASDWRPYTDGYWAHTDEYGWLWVSNESWGWAPFHYGRWAWDNWYGWIWVPGRTWAPAWVFWRSGGGYAAWAPMPPNVVWQPGIGLNISYFNYDRDLSSDCWVAVREYDLPQRHISRRIFPSSQNRQIINVTNYNQNITVINNTIVNHGVPVKRIEEVTHQPVVSVVPKVHDRMDINTPEHDRDQGRPNIIRLPMAAPTPDEIHHNEELARRLDGKNSDGTRTELPVAVNSGQSDNQEPRVPGRLVGTPAQSPRAMPEQRNLAQSEPDEKALPQPAIPETPLVGLNLDTDKHHKGHKVGHNQEEARVTSQSSDQHSSVNIPPTIPAQSQTDGAFSPAHESDRQVDSLDSAAMPLLQNELQPFESGKQHDFQPLQTPDADQHQSENIRRGQKTAPQQEAQNQQQMESQRQQAESANEEAKQMQQQEVARQQEAQNQQQMEAQRQQTESTREGAQQMQQQEVARQQEAQNQQQMKAQRQQAERANEDAQQMQQQEAGRQQEIQNQQQMETQRQQAERARADTQQIQQQEAARQQEAQNQQQMEAQRQQAERAREDAQQMQQQEAARQQEAQNQQQMEAQRQQAERAREDAQQMQQQEATRQQEAQNQQQMEGQRQQAGRARKERQ